MPAIAHQRLAPASQPAYSSPAMPYLLMDEDDIVVLPRRRRYARLHEELDDDPVLQWYEDRIHHAQADAIFNANKRIADLCAPSPSYISTAPPYVQGKYREPLPAEFHKYRTPTTEHLKPIRANIELKSRLVRGPGPAEYRYRRYDDAAPPSSGSEPARHL